MSQCPSYYYTASGMQFYQFYASNCTPIVHELTQDQSHALASASEYIFRAGRKTANPIDDFRKAKDLILRIIKLPNEKLTTSETEDLISKVIGQVVRCKIEAEIAEKPNTVDLTDPIVTAWGAIAR